MRTGGGDGEEEHEGKSCPTRLHTAPYAELSTSIRRIARCSARELSTILRMAKAHNTRTPYVSEQMYPIPYVSEQMNRTPYVSEQMYGDREQTCSTRSYHHTLWA